MFCVFLCHEHEIRCLLTIETCRRFQSRITSSVMSNYCRSNWRIRSVTHGKQNLQLFTFQMLFTSAVIC